MTTLFAGTEEIEFTITGSVSVDTGGALYRSAWSREGLIVNGATTDPPANRIAALGGFSPQSSLWIHARWSNNSVNTTASGAQMIRLMDGSTARLLVRGTGTAGTLKISKRTAAGTITDLVTASGTYASVAGTIAIDLFVNYAVSGQATLYLNGVQAATFSGDVTTDAATTLSSVEFSAPSTGGNTSIWSECIASDSDTRAQNYFSLAPVAAGNTQSWTPNTVGNINERGVSDATLISTSSNNALSEWTTPTALPAGSWAVRSVHQAARVEVGATGPQHFDWVVRTTDGTDNFAGASIAPTTSFGNFSKIWATNPKTGTTWATGDIGTGFNLGIESLA